MRRGAGVFAAVVLCTCGVVCADELHVPGQYPTVQAAIDAAVDGDEVVVAPGTYRELIDMSGKGITLRSVDPSDASVVGATVLSGDLDGDGAGDGTVLSVIGPSELDTHIRGLRVVDGSGTKDPDRPGEFWGGGLALFDASVTLEDCQFMNSAATWGAGAFVSDGATLVARRCRFEGNIARAGGAIYVVRSADAEIAESRFVANVSDGTAGSAGFGGGAIAVITDSDLLVRACEFTANTAVEEGGAVKLFGFQKIPGSRATVIGCSFRGNTSGDRGGGIAYDLGSSLVVSASLFRGNSTGGSGGAIGYSGGTGSYAQLVIDRSMLLGNRAGRYGGAVHAFATQTTISQSILAGNSAAEQGGALRLWVGSDLISGSVDHCTIAWNSAGESGGAVYGALLDDGGAVFSIRSCVLYGNDSPVGPEIMLSDLIVPAGLLVRNSVVSGGYPGPGNIDADPLFVRPPSDGGDGWGDNPDTPGIDESLNDDFGDLRLMPGSPAIDAGDNTSVPPDTLDLDADGDTSEPTPFDLAGAPRFVNDPSTPDSGVGPGPIVDMGAYEYQSPACNPSDLAAPFGVLNFDDVLAFLTAYAAGDPLADLAPAYGELNFNDVLIFLVVFVEGCG